jgi:hypothetical protein
MMAKGSGAGWSQMPGFARWQEHPRMPANWNRRQGQRPPYYYIDSMKPITSNALVIPGRGQRPRARNPYSLLRVMDSGLAASRRPGMTSDMIRTSKSMYYFDAERPGRLVAITPVLGTKEFTSASLTWRRAAALVVVTRFGPCSPETPFSGDVANQPPQSSVRRAVDLCRKTPAER